MNNTEFKIEIPITRAKRDSDGNMWIEGVASSTALDNHGTIFSKNCQEGFAFQIQASADTDEPIKIEVEHKGEEEPMNHIGTIREAYVTTNNELFVRAILDPANPKAVYYFNVLSNPDPKLGRPKRLGFSINGGVQEAHWEFKADVGKNVRIFDRVRLKKVGIVRAPSNSDTWVEKVARSVDWNAVSIKENSMAEEIKVAEETTTIATEETVVERAADEQIETAEVVVQTEEIAEVAAEETVAEAVEEVATEVVAEVVETAVEQTAGVQVVERSEEPTLKELMEIVTRMAKSLEDLEPIIRSAIKVELVEETVEREYAACPECGAVHAPEGECVVRELTTDNSTALQKEDLSDEVETRSEEVVTTDEETVTREAVAGLIASAVTTALEEVTRKVDELQTKLTTVETEKLELVERLAKVEKQPASTPGNVLIEEVTRRKNLTEKDRYEEAVRRAKETGDKEALIKLQILGVWNKLS